MRNLKVSYIVYREPYLHYRSVWVRSDSYRLGFLPISYWILIKILIRKMKTFKWEVSERNFFYPSQIYGSKHYSLWKVWNNFTKSLHDYHVRSRISKYPIKNCHYENFWLDTSEYRCSRPEVFCRKSVLKNFAKFKGELLCQSLLFKKVAVSFLKKLQALGLIFLLKMGLWHKCFPVNFAKLLRTPFLQNTSGGCFCEQISISL